MDHPLQCAILTPIWVFDHRKKRTYATFRLGLRYVFINNLGASIGTMVGPQVTGLFVEANPIVFCYSVSTLTSHKVARELLVSAFNLEI